MGEVQRAMEFLLGDATRILF
ncbi:hypothetical protein Godav_027851 [Gossypium davidsonii]|uniref:Uncharacterized protein n=2 Tax=Gossypium TaxID=3633 RepID=A0A7J8RYA4_GOSDV|nr:hypothetical protein [Gossypium davidsonii]MBA0671235.1 hypothetical protein [Gossypium klotzschianum]